MKKVWLILTLFLSLSFCNDIDKVKKILEDKYHLDTIKSTKLIDTCYRNNKSDFDRSVEVMLMSNGDDMVFFRALIQAVNYIDTRCNNYPYYKELRDIILKNEDSEEFEILMLLYISERLGYQYGTIRR